MFGVLKKLFENKNINRVISLRQQLSDIKMTKSDLVASHLMNISKLRDQLSTIGELIEDRAIIMMNLNGSPPPRNHSLRVLVGDPNFPSLIDCG